MEVCTNMIWEEGVSQMEVCTNMIWEEGVSQMEVCTNFFCDFVEKRGNSFKRSQTFPDLQYLFTLQCKLPQYSTTYLHFTLL